MQKEQLDKIKQMMLSENTDDANMVGVVIRQLFKDEESFIQFVKLMNTDSLYSMKDMLMSNIVNPYPNNQRAFQIKLSDGWFKTNDVILTQLAGDD